MPRGLIRGTTPETLRESAATRGRSARRPAGASAEAVAVRQASTTPGGTRAAAQAHGPDAAVRWLVVRGATHNNLKNIDVAIPLGRFVGVTGVSGSGKSSLVRDILYEALARDLNGSSTAQPGQHRGIDGEQHLDKVICIDQTPIGRTPRSNPATYIKLFDQIRDLFTRLPDAKLRGYKPGRFSFNVAAHKGGGRCEACEGNGANRIGMDFLADLWVTCPVCEGKRFARETRQIQFKGRSIADVLEMDVAEALQHFENIPAVRRMLQTLHDVGLDYIKLGQPSTTLSGGEAQRIKLARELVKRPTGRTLYVLDEPTTGLHFEDIRKLLAVLHGFVDAGNTVVVIEHNLDVVKTADWIIDLGPEGGEAGGYIVAEGTPEEIAACEGSYTGDALREVLGAKFEVRSQKSEVRTSERTASPRGDVSDFVLQTSDFITVRGARQHNLKDLTVSIPRDRITVCTGVSGSGKTSFAIDTLYTEGYRRYVESLSAYARQFLGQMAKPDVDHVEGLSPAICIEQKAASRSPRSTVGTVTEVFDYMRVLWARVGRAHCPRCQAPIGSQTVDEISARVLSLPASTPIILLAPVRPGDNESYAALFNRLKSSGYTRVRIDGEIQPTAQATTLDSRRKHRVELVVDRTVVKPTARGRITESIEHALALGNGVMTLVIEPLERDQEGSGFRALGSEQGGTGVPPVDGQDARSTPNPESKIQDTESPAPRELMFSQKRACTRCGESYEELSPHHFSFNSPMGWCETCEGLGVQRGAPAAAIIRHPERPLLDGAVAGWGRIDPRTPFGRMLTALCQHLRIDPKTPLGEWSHEQRQALLYGTAGPGGTRGTGGAGVPPGDSSIDGTSAFSDWAAGVNPRSATRSPQSTRDPQTTAHNAGVRFHWRGFFPAIDDATRNSWSLRFRLHNVVTDIPCITCRGGRLRPEPAAARLGDKTIVEVCNLPLAEAARFFAELRLDKRQREIAGELLHEITSRLQFLIDVGLEYLTLHRAAPTLSGGEAQRIQLASQIGSGLSGVLYVLDEPTIGLHPRDTRRLIDALQKLRRLGNTLLLVEHDREVIHSADRLLDFGPRAGRFGGEIVAEGPPEQLQTRVVRASRPSQDGQHLRAALAVRASADTADLEPPSLTQGYLDGTLAIPIPANRRPIDPESWRTQPAYERPSRRRRRVGQPPAAAPVHPGARRARPAHPHASPDAPVPAWLIVRAARHNNLKNLDVPIPLGRFLCVTGVSGSGKSSLVNDILWPAAANRLHMASLTPGAHERIDGLEHIDKVVNVDQSPIGTTPSSNPATYTGVFDLIRELFARLPDSKVRGYEAKRFSFNRPGGRCEACEGQGQKCIEMHFMPDVWVECEVCHGRRYNPETLAVKFKGRSIADVLDLRVRDALDLFANVPRVRRLLTSLAEVGLDYLQLGQPAPTLSGGEAQRVKLAAELGKPDTGRTLYILDEPTTGLHFDDVRKLLEVLHRLVDLGNTVLVVEHNLDVLKNADWIIDLGPEAGDAGGCIVAMGTPEAITNSGVTKSEVKKSPRDSGASGAAIGRSEVGSQTAEVGSQESRGPGAATPLTSDFLIPNSEFPSHTAAALRPILAAGPYETRRRYDAASHAEQQMKIEKAGLGDVGREVRMPWQIDGRRWHLLDRTDRDGKPRRWEPAALEYVIDLVEQIGRELARATGGRGSRRAVNPNPERQPGAEPPNPQRQRGALAHAHDPNPARQGQGHHPSSDEAPSTPSLLRRPALDARRGQASVPTSLFSPTNWNNRASVEITAPDAPVWFLHALTGGEWLLELYFRVPQGGTAVSPLSFDPRDLNRRLGLKTLDERTDLPIYGDWPRVEVRPRHDGFDAVAIYVHDKAEIATPAFRRFVKDTAKAYLRMLHREF